MSAKVRLIIAKQIVRYLFSALVVCVSLCFSCRAVGDIVICEEDERYEGEIVQEHPSFVVIKIGNGHKGIPRTKIKEIIYMNPEGANIGPELDEDDYSEGMAAVKIRGKWGYADDTGKIAIGPRFDKAMPFNEGLARVLDGDQWGFIDVQGKYIIQPQYEDVQDFNEGLAPVKAKGLWGYIEISGRPVIECQYAIATIFSGGKAWVMTQGREGYIDSDGNPSRNRDKEQ